MDVLINKNYSSPNYDDREGTIDTIIIHSTHLPFAESLTRLCDSNSKVSAHYLINLEGIICQLVINEKRAWHCGVSYWRGKDKINNFSIGIEIVDTDDLGQRLDYFNQLQMHSTLKLCSELIKNYNIPARNIIAHSDIAPDRKDDPGEFFNWKFLADKGVGIYHSHVIKENYSQINYCESTSNILEIQKMLLEYGYKIELTGIFDQQTVNVIKAFKRHFYSQNLDQTFDLNAYQILKEIYDTVK